MCSPTQKSIYSGTWPWRNGVGFPVVFQLDPAIVTTLPELLGPEGYESGLFGKWPLGMPVGFPWGQNTHAAMRISARTGRRPLWRSHSP